MFPNLSKIWNLLPMAENFVAYITGFGKDAHP